MRVVLDTNVFVSGIHWSGPSERILYKWFDDEFELVCSEPIIEEIAKTLMNFRIPISFDDLLWWISIIIGKSIMTEPVEKLDVVKEDADDNKFLEAAVESGAKYIVSQDKHLLNIKGFRGIKIINPVEFLELAENQ